MSVGPRRAMGCGLGVILAVILVISLVGWALSFLDVSSPARQLQPVPDNVPPVGGEEVPGVDVNAEGRTSDKLDFWASPISAETSIPGAALRAYGNAELIARETWPECNLRWNTLAGVGWVETRHGTYSGDYFNRPEINEDGFAVPHIIGIPLDGGPGVAEIRDTDDGRLDGDTVFDRAVGPMQFIPESWERYGRDANGDGVADPHQIDDAALGAANLLCSGGRDLSSPEGWTSAIGAYNRSNEYIINVRDAAASYALLQPAR